MKYHFFQCDGEIPCDVVFAVDENTSLFNHFHCPACDGTDLIELGVQECDVWPVQASGGDDK